MTEETIYDLLMEDLTQHVDVTTEERVETLKSAAERIQRIIQEVS